MPYLWNNKEIQHFKNWSWLYKLGLFVETNISEYSGHWMVVSYIQSSPDTKIENLQTETDMNYSEWQQNYLDALNWHLFRNNLSWDKKGI